jgi:hypothetical protein
MEKKIAGFIPAMLFLCCAPAAFAQSNLVTITTFVVVGETDEQPIPCVINNKPGVLLMNVIKGTEAETGLPMSKKYFYCQPDDIKKIKVGAKNVRSTLDRLKKTGQTVPTTTVPDYTDYAP